MISQLDVFAAPVSPTVAQAARPSVAANDMRGADDEDMARHLEAIGNYRILRKLQPRPEFPRQWVIVDTEATGPNYRTDEIIEIAWPARGFEGIKLGYLIRQSGYFHEGNRAVADCFALLEALGQIRPDAIVTPFVELYQASQRSRVRIFAENSPFDTKDHLKARGYRWADVSDGRLKSWRVGLSEEKLDEELHFSRLEIYGWHADPPVKYLTAYDRSLPVFLNGRDR